MIQLTVKGSRYLPEPTAMPNVRLWLFCDRRHHYNQSNPTAGSER